MRPWLASVCGVLALAGCGGGAHGDAPKWKDLRRVSITVGNASLPPPFGRPRTTVYTTPSQVARVTAQLNAHRIARQPHSDPTDGGCTGGYQVEISIHPATTAPVALSGYHCAHTTYGIAGDLPGLLTSLGLPTP